MSTRHPSILVTGGTGALGRVFAETAAAAGHRVRVMSRGAARGIPVGCEWVRADLVSGAGLEEAVRGAEIVLHAATDPGGEPWATDVEGTMRLLQAAERASVRHLVYPSIVGVDRMPFPYYQAKAEAERRIDASDVPHTTVRITQFHSFIDTILERAARLPVMPLPTDAKIQSIAVEEAANVLLRHSERGPSGRTPDVGGPEILGLGKMARSWTRARDKRRWVIWAPFPGEPVRSFRKGLATAPERKVGKETWETWLQRIAADRVTQR